MERLCNTQEASQITGLSVYELRMGAKSGKYPCFICGNEDSKFRKIRWNVPVLMAAIEKQMLSGLETETR